MCVPSYQVTGAMLGGHVTISDFARTIAEANERKCSDDNRLRCASLSLLGVVIACRARIATTTVPFLDSQIMRVCRIVYG